MKNVNLREKILPPVGRQEYFVIGNLKFVFCIEGCDGQDSPSF